MQHVNQVKDNYFVTKNKFHENMTRDNFSKLQIRREINYTYQAFIFVSPTAAERKYKDFIESTFTGNNFIISVV